MSCAVKRLHSVPEVSAVWIAFDGIALGKITFGGIVLGGIVFGGIASWGIALDGVSVNHLCCSASDAETRALGFGSIMVLMKAIAFRLAPDIVKLVTGNVFLPAQ